MESTEGLHYSGAAGAEMDMETISKAFFSPDHPAGSGTIQRAGSNVEEELCLQTRSILGAGFQDKRGQNGKLPEAEGRAVPLRGAYIDEGSVFEGELYQEFGPSAHGGFVVAKQLESDTVCCVLVEPMGRGPRAALIGAYLRGAVASLLSRGLLRNISSAPANVLGQIDKILDTALDELAIPGAMAAMSAVVVSARTSRVSVLCRGAGGVAALRTNGAPAWMDGGGAPLFGVMPSGFMPPEFLPGSVLPKMRTYTFVPGDALVLVNGQFDDIPGFASIAAKGIVPVLAARARHGGQLSAGGVTLELPPPEATGHTLPERMALALHALRLVGLKLDAYEPCCNLVLEADQAAYFERICRASGIEVPLPESSTASSKTYADAAPLNAKPPLAFYLRRT